jgi:hypothetical protein
MKLILDRGNGRSMTVGKIYPLLSKWTVIDALLAPFSDKLFEKVARKYAYRPRAWSFFAAVSAVMGSVLLVVACAGFAMVGKHLYLNTYGVKALGTVTSDTSDIRKDGKGREIQWDTIRYTFTTRQGATIKDEITRRTSELLSVPSANVITILYWERFPSINAPRGVRMDILETAGVAAMCGLGGLHIVCIARRMVRWRRRLSNPIATANATPSCGRSVAEELA